MFVLCDFAQWWLSWWACCTYINILNASINRWWQRQNSKKWPSRRKESIRWKTWHGSWASLWCWDHYKKSSMSSNWDHVSYNSLLYKCPIKREAKEQYHWYTITLTKYTTHYKRSIKRNKWTKLLKSAQLLKCNKTLIYSWIMIFRDIVSCERCFWRCHQIDCWPILFKTSIISLIAPWLRIHYIKTNFCYLQTLMS